MLISRLLRLVRLIDALSDWAGRTVAWLGLGTVIVTFAVVVLRYGLDWGSIALQESAIYLHATVFMVGAAYTLRHDAHVRVDIFYRDMSPRGQAWVNLLGSLLLLLPICGFILWTSAGYVADSWLRLEGSREAGGLPAVFLLKSLIPLMAALLALQGAGQALSSLAQILGVDDATPTEDQA